MRILGIESSCDETAAAVVEDGHRLLSHVVNSQIDIHAEYGGVIPEVAARSHIEVVTPVIDKALSDAGCTWNDIDAIAVTYAPGLVGSLLIGTLAARTLAYLYKKPLIPVHHVEGHVYANFLTEADDRRRNMENGKAQEAPASKDQSCFKGDVAIGQPNATGAQPRKVAPEKEGGSLQDLKLPSRTPQFPLLALIVSGGHSQLVLFRDHGDYELLGQTQDDAVGEAFDKVAKIIGLPYPGGPSVAKAALDGNPSAFTFPIAKLSGAYDFSFSGLKTAVLRTVQREVGVDHTFPSHQLPERVSDTLRNDIAASFQHTAIKTLVQTARRAYDAYQPASVVIAGGVAANQELRRQLSEALPLPIEYAPMSLCTDNAAMIATLGCYMFERGKIADPLSLEVVPSLSMTKTSWK